MELQRQRAKDEAERKRQEFMAGQSRFYGEALKHSLSKMGLVPINFPSYFALVENLFFYMKYLSNTFRIFDFNAQ